MITPRPRAGQRADVLQHGDLVAGIQVIDGLVQQQDRRILGQQAGQGESPPLTAGQRGYQPVLETGETHGQQRGPGSREVVRRILLPCLRGAGAGPSGRCRARWLERSRRRPAGAGPGAAQSAGARSWASSSLPRLIDPWPGGGGPPACAGSGSCRRRSGRARRRRRRRRG